MKTVRDFLDEVRAADGREAVAAGLSAALAALAEGDSCERVAELCELAELFDELLGDDEQARSCLESALEGASEPADFVRLADVYAERPGGRATARQLIARSVDAARASAELDPHVFWSIANLQRHTLDDAEGARQTLTTGLELCRSVDQVLTIARAWHASFPGRPGYRRALDAAAGLATDSEHWVALADVVFDGATAERGADKPAIDPQRTQILEALEAGLALASDDAEKRAVATGFRALLGDSERADAISPSGLLASEIAQPLWTLEGWTADPARLLDLLRPQLDRPVLRGIAQADYGSEEPRHLSALLAIWESGLVPYPLPWHPREVLELVRWDEGDDVDHLRRAFACTVLCVEATGPDYRDGMGQTIAVALESCRVLGREAVEAYEELTAALIQAHEDCAEGALFGLLGLLLARASLDPADPRLPGLVARIESLEIEHAGDDYARPEHGWLLGTTYFDQRHALWRQLSEDILGGEAAAGFEHLARVRARLARGEEP